MQRKSKPKLKLQREREWSENIDCAFGFSWAQAFLFYDVSMRNIFVV